MMKLIKLLALSLVLLSTLSVTLAQTPEPIDVPIFTTEVITTYPHDPASYIQGLVLHEGKFYESAGRYGESQLREVDPTTGEVLRMRPLSEQFFAEGLALVEDRLIQITWQEGIAWFYDLETFQPLGIYFYEGQGWGLCYDGEQLWMSDGSDRLFARNPITFKVEAELPVTIGGTPQSQINELECVGETIYANIYQTDEIVQIDKATGEVIALIDASNLLTPEKRATLQSGEVLNGIAYDPEQDVFYLTGKRWDTLFEVRFVPVE